MSGKSIPLVLTLLAGLLCGCEPAPDVSPPPAPETDTTPASAQAGAVGLISEQGLREYVARISADRFGGRAPGSEGDELARQYLAETMQTLGLEPGGPDGGWEQAFDLVGIDASAPPTWEFNGAGTSLVLHRDEQYIAASGVQADTAVMENAEVVFAGYGINAPEYDWDDFKDADVNGKILLVMNNDPDWAEDLFAGNTRLYYGRWSYKYENAARHGALGVIIIHTRESAGYPWQVVRTSWSGEQFELVAGNEPRIQVAAWVTEDAARQLTAMSGHDFGELVNAARSRNFQPVPLGVTASLRLTNTVRTVKTANVLGLLRGSDPQLADQLVVYSAHHDHLGIGAPDSTGDTIYNGARDNGSGVATVMSIAGAFASMAEKPRRSILFAFVAAEEQGLLGSAYYADNPTVPAGQIAANINYDSANIWGTTRDITYVGLGKSSLDDLVVQLAADQGRTVKPDQFPDRGYFYRSDQFNFARIGVPAIYLKNGTDFTGRPAGWGRQQVEYYEDHNYHQPSDELTDDWNFSGMVEDAWLGYQLGLHIANSDSLPRWNPGDEFEAARVRALEDLQD